MLIQSTRVSESPFSEAHPLQDAAFQVVIPSASCFNNAQEFAFCFFCFRWNASSARVAKSKMRSAHHLFQRSVLKRALLTKKAQPFENSDSLTRLEITTEQGRVIVSADAVL